MSRARLLKLLERGSRTLLCIAAGAVSRNGFTGYLVGNVKLVLTVAPMRVVALAMWLEELVWLARLS